MPSAESVSSVAPGDPAPLSVGQTNWWRWITPALSFAILAVVIWQIRLLDIDQIRTVLPTNPAFWIVIVLYYFAGTTADFVIFRKLWGIPFEGFIALLRKNVSNAILVDYLGEAYFYSWARRKVNLATSPFGAVKDVAILSALISNVVTLVMMPLAYPFAHALNLGLAPKTLMISVGIIALVSVLIVIFGNRLFSLTKAELWWVSGIHLGRLILSNALLALAWNLALPDVALGWWLVLVTIHMLLSRLPLISNKDVIFAGAAVFFIGFDNEIKLLIALTATLLTAMHLIVGAALAVGDLVTVNRDGQEKAA